MTTRLVTLFLLLPYFETKTRPKSPSCIIAFSRSLLLGPQFSAIDSDVHICMLHATLGKRFRFISL